jgi:hypothetical protein
LIKGYVGTAPSPATLAATKPKPLSNYNFIKFEELQNSIQNDSSENHFKTAAKFLVNALSDWPTYNLKEPYELINELKIEINNSLTFETLNNYISTLNPNIENNMWKIESVNALLELFDFGRTNNFNKNISLESIIENITKHYKA